MICSEDPMKTGTREGDSWAPVTAKLELTLHTKLGVNYTSIELTEQFVQHLDEASVDALLDHLRTGLLRQLPLVQAKLNAGGAQ